MSKKTAIFLVVCFIIVIASTLLGFFLSYSKQPVTGPSSSQPTPTSNINQVSVTQAQSQRPFPTIAPDNLENTIENARSQLSDSDSQVRKNLIEKSSLNSYARLYQNDNFGIFYVSDGDIFQVSFYTIPSKELQQEAVDWFLSQGLSKNAICHLPVAYSKFPEGAEVGIIDYSQPDFCSN
jgi:hypothetical protein